MSLREIIIVVDMQNDFLTGSLKNDNAVKIKDNMIKYLKDKLKSKNTEVFFTKDIHDKNYSNTTEGKHLPIKHCVKGTKGCELIKEINDLIKEYNLEDRILEKDKFGLIDIKDKIVKKTGEIKKDDKFILVGVCTSICVITNAAILKSSGENEVYVLEKLCACLSKDSHKSAIEAMKAFQVNII